MKTEKDPMCVYSFIDTDITNTELTDWILDIAKKRRVQVTDIRYFGSRRFGKPRLDSDIDVYLTTPKNKKHFGDGIQKRLSTMSQESELAQEAWRQIAKDIRGTAVD